ncbi:MAG: hypothetical protein LBR60_04805 [Fibrobacter sp.]|nr:hypothetical protein [Fibrobacter sp.]
MCSLFLWMGGSLHFIPGPGLHFAKRQVAKQNGASLICSSGSYLTRESPQFLSHPCRESDAILNASCQIGAAYSLKICLTKWRRR